MKRYCYLILTWFALSMVQNTLAQETTSQPVPAPVPSANAQANIEKNAEILAWLVVLNSNEIAAAKVALTKRPTAAVEQYANMMVQDHTKNLNATIALSKDLQIKPANNTDVFNMLKQGMTENAQLALTKEVDFPKKYIDAMVAGHTAALTKINGYLTDSGINPRLVEQLKETRTMVEHHLEEAKALQATLDKSVQI